MAHRFLFYTARRFLTGLYFANPSSKMDLKQSIKHWTQIIFFFIILLEPKKSSLLNLLIILSDYIILFEHFIPVFSCFGFWDEAFEPWEARLCCCPVDFDSFWAIEGKSSKCSCTILRFFGCTDWVCHCNEEQHVLKEIVTAIIVFYHLLCGVW